MWILLFLFLGEDRDLERCNNLFMFVNEMIGFSV